MANSGPAGSEAAAPTEAGPTRVFLADDAATRSLGAALAAVTQAGDVILLEGPLGAGKTTLARGFIQALPTAPGGRPSAEAVPSPTFTLVQIYERFPAPVWHIDLYRLSDPEDIWELGLEETFMKAVLLIEWPERLGPLEPAGAIRVRLSESGPDGRCAELSGGPERLHAAARSL